MFSSSNTTSNQHQGVLGNAADAVNPTTGTGSHLPPTESSHNPLSSHNDHRSNERAHNSSILGPNSSTAHSHEGHNHNQTGGVTGAAHALNPTTGTGAHLGQADHSHNPLSSHDDFSKNERSTEHNGLTGAHSHTNNGSNLTGDHHHSSAGGVAGAAHALNPTTGTGAHVGSADHSANPLSSHDDFRKNERSNEHTGLTGANVHEHDHTAAGHGEKGALGRATDAINPTTGRGAHVGSAEYSSNPLVTDDATKKHDKHHPEAHKAENKAEHAKNQAEHKTHNATTPHTGSHAHSSAPNAHPSLVDKVKGTVEVLHGKLTHDPAKVAEGQAKKTGTAL